MVATTPTYGLPYPTSSDPFDDALMDIPQALAEQLEATLAGWGGVVGPSSWAALPWATNWADNATGTGMRGYTKIGTRVDVMAYAQRSTSTSTSGAAVATLPPGFRPPGNVVWPTVRSDTGATFFVTVASTGVISFNAAIPSGVSVPILGYFHL